MKYSNFKLSLRKIIAALFIIVSGSTGLFAQQITVKGIVKDAGNGDPILGQTLSKKAHRTEP